MFHVIGYTYCSPEMSLNGLDGWQIHCMSEGVTENQVQEVMGKYHHQPVSRQYQSDSGDIDVTEPNAHPRTVLFSESGDSYYLASGYSIDPLPGYRPGNQITRVLVTTDEDDFGYFTPAQALLIPEYFAHSFNSHHPPALSPNIALPEHYQNEALAEWLRETPFLANNFASILTMFERTLASNNSRIFIKATKVSDFLRIVALASMYFPKEQQLALSFRAQSLTPINSDYKITGVDPRVSPEITAQWATHNRCSFIDLTAEEISECPPSATSLKIAEWALAFAPEDIVEVTATVRDWEQWMEPQLALDAAAAILLPEQGSTPAISMDSLILAAESIAKNGADNMMSPSWLEDIISILLEDDLTQSEGLIQLAHALLSTGFGGLGIQLMTRTLQSRQADFSQLLRDQPAYWVGLSSVFKQTINEEPECITEFVEELLKALSLGIPAEQLPCVFTILQLLAPPQLKTQLLRNQAVMSNRNVLADYLLDHPEFLADLPYMFDHPLLRKILRQRLSKRLVGDRGQALSLVRKGDYDSLLSHVGPQMELIDVAIALRTETQSRASTEAQQRGYELDQIIEFAPRSAWQFVTVSNDGTTDPELLGRWIGIRTQKTNSPVRVSTEHSRQILHDLRTGAQARRILKILDDYAVVIEDSHLRSRVEHFHRVEEQLQDHIDYGEIRTPFRPDNKDAFLVHLPTVVAMCWSNQHQQDDRRREKLLDVLRIAINNDKAISAELAKCAQDSKLVFLNMLQLTYDETIPLTSHFSSGAIEYLGDEEIKRIAHHYGKDAKQMWSDFKQRRKQFDTIGTKIKRQWQRWAPTKK